MNTDLFNPFDTFSFNDDTCFLSGKKLNKDDVNWVSTFPDWLLDRYQLRENYILMLGGNRLQYKELRMPACSEVAQAIVNLDEITQRAFENGYDEMMKLSDLTLFQLMARIFYGVMYEDYKQAFIEYEEKGQKFQVAPTLIQKFKNLHLMLQSLIRKVEFIDFIPWTIKRYPIDISKDIFNYKDEIQHLNFCLSLNYFGIAACLQDNGEVGIHEADILQKIENKTLHPAQFEELYGRFLYTNYLLRDIPDYLIREESNTITLRLPENAFGSLPKYAPWKDEIFAQVLTNMWNPWGIPLEMVHRYPNSPISYLISERTGEFIPHEQITLDR
ncbi:MAG: hypothetical protein LCH44_09185 [Bacteroidetes bacterium]|nr:hypothetical protein [Bacteroidota bacterium]